MSLTKLILESEESENRKDFFENHTFTESELSDPENFSNLLTEATKATIPENLQKKLSLESTREEMYEKYGEKAFLMPDERKFPVVHPDTGEYNCKLIYAARIRAAQHGYEEVEEKAIELYNEQGCEEKININIEDHEESYDITNLANIIDID
ncbi:MAG: hypothetical protein ACOC1O_02050 [bacterium]